MTDQLETDLRALLAERASAIAADPTGGEQVVADRLRAGDAGLADVVPMAAPHRRGWWLAAAAAAVVALVVGLVVLRDDDKGVETGPVASSTTQGPATSTTTTVVSPTEDPMTAREGESAKDVAERVATTVFPSDEYVTMGVEDRDPPMAGAKVVTMEGYPSRDTLIAYVVPASSGGLLRLSVLAAPSLDGHLTTNTTDGQLTAVDLPEDGSLTMWGYDAGLTEIGRLPSTPVVAGRAEVDAPWWGDSAFVAYELTTAEGQVLRALLPTSAG